MARLSAVEQQEPEVSLTQKGAEAPLNLELPVIDQGVYKPISTVSSAEEDGGRPWTVVARNITSVSRYSTGMHPY